MLNKIVTISCLVLLGLELLVVFVNLALKDRAQRIAFLRSFKKGKCAIIYITAIPLYCIGHLYAGEAFLPAFFDAIGEIINLVVLKYETGSIQALMQADGLYYFAIYFCFTLVTVNALLFTLSLTSQHIWCAIQALKATATRKDKLFLFGNNPENIAIYRSDKKRNKVIIDDISPAKSEKLYMDRIAFISARSYDEPVNHLARLLKRFDREHIIVVNTGSDEENMTLCRALISHIDAAEDAVKDKLFLTTKIFVFGDPRYETIYADIVSSGYGCVHYVNKYQKIAQDFIDRYPLARFMDGRQIDYETSLVKDGTDINVLLIGFGKTNQQIFLTSVANNQFLQAGAEDAQLKKVKYIIFDRAETENNKNLNHNYYRYRYECADIKPEDYLPLPDFPAEETFLRLDVNDCEFYNRIRVAVTRSDKDANFVVIAFGTDLENLDMAQKLVEKRKEWGAENLVIFVKVRSWQKEQTLLENEDCYFIGNENEVVYDLEKIVGDRIFQMAQMRNEVYDLENAITNNPDLVVDDAYIRINHDAANRRWHMRKSEMERQSSVYCCLSLRAKLNLMGLDYCRQDEGDTPGLTEEAYLERYAGSHRPDTGKYSGVRALGKPIVDYTLEFPPCRRRNMAIHEHQRWNSFMISKGMIPASRQQIKTETAVDKDGQPYYTNGRNYAVRRHGNLTTFAGLVEFRQLVAKRDKCPEEQRDVIKYDYQLLDDAHWLLRCCGYKIVEKNDGWK